MTIDEAIKAILDDLGLDPNLVRQLELRPAGLVITDNGYARAHVVKVEVYKLRDGQKYLDEADEPATEWRNFKVNT